MTHTEVENPLDLYYWLALERVPRVGPLTIAKLIAVFGNPKTVLEVSAADLRRQVGLSQKLSEIISEYVPPEKDIRKDIEILKETNTKLILRWDQSYPSDLKEVHDPPAMLFVRGNIAACNDRAVGIVGTRNPTAYGLDMTRSLTRDFVRAGITVVSGLARGIDTECHKTALKEGGKTIGVLGCGINIVYPRENGPLIDGMAQAGAVVSEFRPGIQPLGTNFYRRNRIISGMSKGVIVVEAALGSGSLITAKHALDQNRDVFAVPGNTLNSRSAGPHHLLKQGAGLVERASDVIENLFAPAVSIRQPTLFPKSLDLSLSPEAERIYETIDLDPIHIDLICEAVKIEVGKVSGLLLELELNGFVRQYPGKMFARSHD